MDGSGEGQMKVRCSDGVQVESNLKSILSLTLVDLKLVVTKMEKLCKRHNTKS